MRKLALVATSMALGLSALAAPASAQETVSDVRCMLASHLFSNSDKPEAKAVAGSALLYYGGRVAGLPDAQLESAMRAELKQLTGVNAGATMNACAQQMSARLKELQTIGAKLQEQKR